ncbi:hypothetical protein [Bradyrhizobium sp. CCBAU 51745]|uniref:hypothetical protein n=1 Tax=Bradyrhizobium sp. CCBAU 51745 TaxID=1325099 RepID=UPI00230539DC|nr:hypothetical protein [Bradyrhizobium sp. CCBAU 51745]
MNIDRAVIDTLQKDSSTSCSHSLHLPGQRPRKVWPGALLEPLPTAQVRSNDRRM